jgi:hypothetical protein
MAMGMVDRETIKTREHTEEEQANTTTHSKLTLQTPLAILTLSAFSMKLSSTLIALSATAVLAAPAADLTVEKRATTGVYLCNDRDWQGYCVHIPSAPSECVPLAGDLNDLVSSAGPDQGSFCYFFV